MPVKVVVEQANFPLEEVHLVPNLPPVVTGRGGGGSQSQGLQGLLDLRPCDVVVYGKDFGLYVQPGQTVCNFILSG